MNPAVSWTSSCICSTVQKPELSQTSGACQQKRRGVCGSLEYISSGVCVVQVARSRLQPWPASMGCQSWCHTGIWVLFRIALCGFCKHTTNITRTFCTSRIHSILTCIWADTLCTARGRFLQTVSVHTRLHSSRQPLRQTDTVTLLSVGLSWVETAALDFLKFTRSYSFITVLVRHVAYCSYMHFIYTLHEEINYRGSLQLSASWIWIMWFIKLIWILYQNISIKAPANDIRLVIQWEPSLGMGLTN